MGREHVESATRDTHEKVEKETRKDTEPTIKERNALKKLQIEPRKERKMKNFEFKLGDSAAQGDMMITCIDKLPENIKPISIEDGKFILTQSESGHHHSVKFQPEIEFYANDNNPFIAYLVVNNTVEALVEHERSFDTHETICLLKDTEAKEEKRIYEIRRQVEYTPEGLRRAQD